VHSFGFYNFGKNYFMVLLASEGVKRIIPKRLLFLALIYGVSFRAFSDPPGIPTADENLQPPASESPSFSGKLTDSDLCDKGLEAYETKDYS
jgi:hypothetical protein